MSRERGTYIVEDGTVAEVAALVVGLVGAHEDAQNITTSAGSLLFTFHEPKEQFSGMNQGGRGGEGMRNAPACEAPYEEFGGTLCLHEGDRSAGDGREGTDDDWGKESSEADAGRDEVLPGSADGAGVRGREGRAVGTLVLGCGDGCPKVMIKADAADDVKGGCGSVGDDVDGSAATGGKDLVGQASLEFL